MKRLIFLFILPWSSIIWGQTSSGLNQFKDFKSEKQLKVGDRVPDIAFNKMLNYKSTSAKLSDFRKKLVILDFWNTNCAVCIREFPKMNALQRKFGEKIMILPVGTEQGSNANIQNFLNKMKGTPYELHLPTAVEVLTKKLDDNRLYRLFQWQSMPHEVWIDGNGVLIAVTDHRAVTEENITSLLNGERSGLPNRKSQYDLSCADQFLINYKGKDINNLFSESRFTGFNDTLYSSWRLLDSQCDSSIWRFVAINQPVFHYYSMAYGDTLPILSKDLYYKRIVTEASKEKAFYKKWSEATDLDNWDYAEFAQHNLFCYEMIRSRSYSKSEVFRHMIKDFDHYFQVASRIENRRVKCLALISIPGKEKFSNTDGVFKRDISLNGDTIKLGNYALPEFVDDLNRYIKDVLIIDETGYQGRIDLTICLGKKARKDAWRESLQQHGLDLVEVEREMPMLVLKRL